MVSDSPADRTACVAAASAYWLNRSVPSRTFSSIQSAGSKPVMSDIQEK